MGEALLGLQERQSDPTSMPAGWGRIFFKNDKRLYLVDDTLTVSRIALQGDPPTPHATSHSSGGEDPLNLSASQITSGVLDASRLPPIDLTTGVTGVLPVSNGGVGSATRPNVLAYLSSNVTVPNDTFMVVPLNARHADFDNRDFNTATYRFVPSVAGFYLISFLVVFTSTNMVVGKRLAGAVFKNGTLYTIARGVAAALDLQSFAGTTVMFLNGSTDYVELRAHHAYGSGINAELRGGMGYTQLTGFLLSSGHGL